MDTEFGKAALEDGDLYGKIAGHSDTGHRDRYVDSLIHQ